jgi:integrase
VTSKPSRRAEGRNRSELFREMLRVYRAYREVGELETLQRYGAARAWRERQRERAAEGSDNVHGLVFTTRNGRPVDQRNVTRAFHRARTAAGVDHGSLKTFRSTVATQLADAGLHPSKTQAFLGHAHVTTTLTYYTAITDVDEAAGLLPDLQ